MLKRAERSDHYLIHVCRLLQSTESIGRIGKKSVAFISCRTMSTSTADESQCLLKAPVVYLFFLHSLCSGAVCRYESGRCCSFLPLFTIFYFLKLEGVLLTHLPGISMTGTCLKQFEKRLALSVALMRITLRSVRCGKRSRSISRRKSLRHNVTHSYKM